MTTGTEPTLSTDSSNVCPVHGQRIGDRGCPYCAMDDEALLEQERAYDPTPWCSGGHMSEASCTCGEIDSHD
jgi:hypothetical protein